MGPDFGLAILVPAALIALATILGSAKQAHALHQRHQDQATSSSNPIWPPANKR